MKLNRTHVFGKITPAWQGDDMDRPAYFEQNGKLYDAHDRLIEPGKKLTLDAPVAKADTEDSNTALLSASKLLAASDSMPWAKFRAAAKKILGDTCPADKESIKAALSTALAAVEAREAKRAPNSQQSNGLTWDALAGGPETNGVDLKAWAQGQREYLFGDVQKAIRKGYSKQVSERRDAVDFLVEQGLLTAENARKDVYAIES